MIIQRYNIDNKYTNLFWGFAILKKTRRRDPPCIVCKVYFVNFDFGIAMGWALFVSQTLLVM